MPTEVKRGFRFMDYKEVLTSIRLLEVKAGEQISVDTCVKAFDPCTARFFYDWTGNGKHMYVFDEDCRVFAFFTGRGKNSHIQCLVSPERIPDPLASTAASGFDYAGHSAPYFLFESGFWPSPNSPKIK